MSHDASLTTLAGPGATTLKGLQERIDRLESLRDRVLRDTASEPCLAGGAQALSTALQSLLTGLRATLSAREMEEGCSHCGAQSGQDCRIDTDIGYCIWAEEAAGRQ